MAIVRTCFGVDSYFWLFGWNTQAAVPGRVRNLTSDNEITVMIIS
jgi:hypothetical protein